MLDRGIRHLPVLSPTGAVLGVLEDADLVSVVTRTSFQLRAAVARATTREGLAAAAARLRPATIELHAARVPAGEVAAIRSVVMDAVCRRLFELAVAKGEVPPCRSPGSRSAASRATRRSPRPTWTAR
jgi:CBS domain-containing protein